MFKHFEHLPQHLVSTLSLVATLIFCAVGCGTSSTQQSSMELKPFSSDGCSSFPDGTLSRPDAWKHCCYEHDKSYWPGGTRSARLAADQQLASCVAGEGYPLTAKLIYAGVRIGGIPYLPTPFRWGFGRPWFHAYDE